MELGSPSEHSPHPPTTPTPTSPRTSFLGNMVSVDEISACLRSDAWRGHDVHFLRNVQVGEFGPWEEKDFIREHERVCVAEERPFRSSPMFVESRCQCEACGGQRVEHAAVSEETKEVPDSTPDVSPCVLWSLEQFSTSHRHNLPAPFVGDLWGHYTALLPVGGLLLPDATTPVNVVFLFNTIRPDGEPPNAHALSLCSSLWSASACARRCFWGSAGRPRAS